MLCEPSVPLQGVCNVRSASLGVYSIRAWHACPFAGPLCKNSACIHQMASAFKEHEETHACSILFQSRPYCLPVGGKNFLRQNTHTHSPSGDMVHLSRCTQNNELILYLHFNKQVMLDHVTTNTMPMGKEHHLFSVCLLEIIFLRGGGDPTSVCL